MPPSTDPDLRVSDASTQGAYDGSTAAPGRAATAADVDRERAAVDAALAQMSEGVIVTDAVGRITLVNEAAARLHGVAALDVPVEAYTETYHLFTEDGEPYVPEELPLARAARRGEHVVDARWRIRRPDGTEIVAIGSARPLLAPDGSRVGALLTVRDDTARVAAERAERRAARLLAQISDAHVAFDRDFRIVAVNAAAERALDRPRETLLGRTAWEAFPATLGTEIERRCRRVQQEHEEAHFAHHYVGEGYDFHVEIDAYPTEEDGVAMFWRDVTERVRGAEERERLLEAEHAARAQAEAANRAKSQFLAVMSHELRTPLNAIAGYAELLAMGVRGPITDQQAEDLRRIQTSQRHLLGLINEVLNYARLETGSVHFDLVDVSVHDALVASEALVAPQARAKGLALTVRDVAGALAARADAEKLRQILVNLLSNAIKFTDRGGAVTLDAQPAGSIVCIRVHDTGIGIAADKLGVIFEPFVQVRADLTRVAEGTGLGLAISRDLARGMGGELAVERSAPGVGTTLLLTLPIAESRDGSPVRTTMDDR